MIVFDLLSICRDKEGGLEEISEWMNRLHTLVIGPGLGRDLKRTDVIRVSSQFVLSLVESPVSLWA